MRQVVFFAAAQVFLIEVDGVTTGATVLTQWDAETVFVVALGPEPADLCFMGAGEWGLENLKEWVRERYGPIRVAGMFR